MNALASAVVSSYVGTTAHVLTWSLDRAVRRVHDAHAERGRVVIEEPQPATVRAAADGDLAAFEEIVRTYQGYVWRFLRHLTSDAALAEDLTQETFLRVWTRLPTYAARSAFSTWVFAIARNAGIDALRARSRRERLVAAVQHDTSTPGPERTTEVRAAVASLAPKLREAVGLVDIMGFTYREAGELLRVAEGTVKSRVFHGRQRLVAWFAATEREDADAL